MFCLLHAEFVKAVYTVGPKGLSLFKLLFCVFSFFSKNPTGYILSVFPCAG